MKQLELKPLPTVVKDGKQITTLYRELGPGAYLFESEGLLVVFADGFSAVGSPEVVFKIEKPNYGTPYDDGTKVIVEQLKKLRGVN